MATTSGDDTNGGEFMAAYSPIPHLGLGSRMFLNNSNEITDEAGGYRFFQWDGWIGAYYRLVNHGDISLVASTYLAYSSGHFTNYYESGVQTFSRLEYRRWGVVPGLRLKLAFFDLAGSVRIADFGYQRVVLHGEIMEEDLGDIEMVTASPLRLVEPCFLFGGGMEMTRVFIAVTWSKVRPESLIERPFVRSTTTLGIQVKLGDELRRPKRQRTADDQ